MNRAVEDDVRIAVNDVEPIIVEESLNDLEPSTSSCQQMKCNRDIHSAVFALLLLAVILQLYIFVKAILWQQAVLIL